MRDGISCFFVKKTFPKKAQFGIPLPPWERLETGTFEFLLQAGAIWQSDMEARMCQSYLALWNFRSVFGDVNIFLRIPHQNGTNWRILIQLHIGTRFAVMMNFQQISSLTRQVQEHKDWATFLDWLPQQGAINLFSLLRRCRKFTKCQWN